MSAHVTRLELETSEAGIEVEVTIHRIAPYLVYVGPRADARDVPPDVADALRKWLADAPTEVEA